MHAKEFLNVKENNFKHNVFLLYGEETFYIQKVREKIVQSLNNIDENADFQLYDMETTPIQEAIHDAETFPFFSDHKIVIINRAHFLTGQVHRGDVDHQIDVLTEFIQHPVDFTTVIIIAPYPKLDQRKKITKIVKENSMVIDCTPPNLYDMKSTIQPMAASRGLQLSNEVIDLLIERVGEHIEALDHELEKIALYATNGDISYEQAKSLVSTHAETSTFTLIDALTDNNLGHSLSALKEFRKRNEEPIALLALVASQIRLILQCKLLKKSNYQQQQMAKQLKVHPYAVKMALKRERRFTEEQLKQMIIEAAKCDEQMKTGEKDKWLALEMFIERAGRLIGEPA
ncbi:DNA polymerase III subunit delta [Allobacillus sp. GCM10007491]|uniref:DNA polymerase III subunit delta n=1 Tax=Allobacillus saliphilus TaxID=2912308 RepID=A0A941HS62_9BACI|nr:DNA polymerase III subunit delta [Allobacillus saliphilus]MBR7553346.1 DNA polymerase III subunit delta [Allobacillus saliphilus]